MRILLTHNYYQQRGGEDAVFEHETELLRQHGVVVDTLIFQNLEIRSLPDLLKAGPSSFYSTRSARRMKAKIGEFKPDVIHAHNLFPVASPSVLLEAHRTGVPVVVTLHNYRLICANALLFRDGHVCEDCVAKSLPLNGVFHGCYRHSRLQSAVLTGVTTTHRWLGTWRQSVASYFVVSEFARRKILDAPLGLSPQQLMVKPNSVTDRDFGKTEGRGRFLLYLGRLSNEKGLPHLLEAAQRHGFALKIAGAGPLEPLVRSAASRSSNIEYLGFLSSDVLISLVKQARALVFPSIWFETFGVSIIEALSTGTPVLASRIGGIPEIVQHGYNGLLFEPGSAESIAEQVKSIMSDDRRHELLSLNARTSYLERYTPELNYRKLTDLYETIRKMRNGASDPKEILAPLTP